MNLIQYTDLECFDYKTTSEIIEFTENVNKFNIDKLIPLFEKYIPKNQLEGFLLCEHALMSRQFRVVTTLLRNNSMIQFDGVDLCLSIASLTRTIIENMAIINFLIHDTQHAEEDKIQAIVDFQNMGKTWLANNDISIGTKSEQDRIKILDTFIQENRKEINKSHIWKNISPNNQTLTQLIKNFKFTYPIDKRDPVYKEERLYHIWDGLSKLLHNNLLHRLVLFSFKDNKITMNYKFYEDSLDEAILTLSGLFLDELLSDIVDKINDTNITKIYNEGVAKIRDDRLNKIVLKQS